MSGWLYLVLAGVLEVAWAFGLKNAVTATHWLLTFVSIALAFVFLVRATQKMEASLAYMFFVVFGTIGTYVLDVLLFAKPISAVAILAIVMMLGCVVALKKGAG